MYVTTPKHPLIIPNAFTDYSMLSKTNVHHFAGNNVSQPVLYCIFQARALSVQRPGPGLQNNPREELLTQELGGQTISLTSFPQIELGTACGKLYRCSTMAVLEAGDSDILTGATA